MIPCGWGIDLHLSYTVAVPDSHASLICIHSVLPMMEFFSDFILIFCSFFLFLGFEPYKLWLDFRDTALTLYSIVYVFILTEAVVGRCSVKKVVLNVSQNS